MPGSLEAPLWDWVFWPVRILLGGLKFSVEVIEVQIGEVLLPAIQAVSDAMSAFVRALPGPRESAGGMEP